MPARRHRSWLPVALAALVALAAAASVVARRWRAERSFERELAFLQGRGAELTPQEVVAAALRLPRDRFLVKVIEKGLGKPGLERLLASTAVEYWDSEARDDGLLPRPVHHAHPIRELLTLLPAIARAQTAEGWGDETVDACLVSVWDRPTLDVCKQRPKAIEYTLPPGSLAGRDRSRAWRMRMHNELLGVLLDKDPSPMTKDGFAGLVYGYGSDEELVAAIGSLCAATPR